MKESTIEAAVVRHCKANNLLCYKFTSPARRGVPDRMIIGNGKVLFLELKAPGEKPTKLQEYEHSLLRGAGMAVTWADSVGTATADIDNFFFT